jgi:hypothetical protein
MLSQMKRAWRIVVGAAFALLATSAFAQSIGVSATIAPTTVSVGNTVGLTVTITNPVGAIAPLTGISSSTLSVSNLTFNAVVTNTCPVNVSFPTTVTMTLSPGTGPDLAQGSSCTITITLGTIAGGPASFSIPVNAVSGFQTSFPVQGPTTPQSALITVSASGPPVVTAVSVSPPTARPQEVVSAIYTITNPGTVAANFSGTVDMPSGVLIQATPAPTSSCGATGTIAGGNTQYNYGGGPLAAGATCTITLSVAASAPNVFTFLGIPGNTLGPSASFSAQAPFFSPISASPSTVFAGGRTSITYRIQNPGAIAAATGTVTLPTGFSYAFPPTSTCGLSFTGSGNQFSFSGTVGVISNPCEIFVDAQTPSGSATTYLVAVAPGDVIIGGAPNANNSTTPLSTLVPAAPTVSVTASPSSIATNASATITYTLSNSESINLPIVSGLFSISSAINVSTLSTTCAGSSFTFSGSPSPTLFLNGGVIPANGNCTLTVQVNSPTVGTYNFPVAVGNLTVVGGVTNTVAAITTLTISVAGPALIPPTMTVAVVPTSVPVNTNAIVTYTISNTNAQNLVAASSSTSLLPAGITLASATSDCVGVTGSDLSGPFIIPAESSCTLTWTVNSSVVGNYTFQVNPGVLIAGFSSYTDANTNTSSDVLQVTPAAGPVPVVTSTASVSGTVGTPLNYQITATNSPTSFALTGAPPTGTTFNATTGILSGTPTAAGSFNISVTATNANGTSAPFAVGFSIAAAAPVITSPTTASGVVGTPFSYTITGTNTPVTFSANGLPAGLAVNATTGVISGTPTAAGTFNATIAATNAGGTGSQALSITISAAAIPIVTLTPPGPLTFGAQIVGTTSAPQTVTLANTGSAPLLITSLASAGDFLLASNCPFGSANLPNGTPPLNECFLNITFSPTSATPAARTGTITIVTANATPTTYTIVLNGTASGAPVAGIAVAPTSFNFGGVTVGATSAVQNFVVTNTGTANLTGITVATTPGYQRVAVPPTANGPFDCGVTLAPATSCLIAVRFAPTSVGFFNGQVSITSPAIVPNTFNVAVTGSATPAPAPEISLPSIIDFGDQIINTSSAPRTVAIANTGTATMTVNSISLTGVDAGSYAITGACASVAPGTSCDVSVTFRPSTLGIKNAALSISSNAQNAASANAVALTGTGVPQPRPITSLSLTTISFGNTIVGAAGTTQTVRLQNTGVLPLVISGIIASPDYLQTNTCPASLPPQATCNVQVQFLPIGLGPRVGEITVVSNAASSPDRVELRGTGCRWFSPSNNRLFTTLCGN